MRVTCKHCGGAHPAFEFRKKSTAARMDVRSSPSVSPTREAEGAGTQALPVDTNSCQAESEGFAPFPSQALGAITSAGTVKDKDRQPKFDRKAWMREYQRNYMRNVYRPKLKASKSNPNTPERNDE